MPGVCHRTVRRLVGFSGDVHHVSNEVVPLTSSSFVSHVLNEVVLRMAGAQPLSKVLVRQQLSHFGRIVRMLDGAAIRQVVFEPGTLQLKSAGLRKRGRPRISWAGAARQHAITAAGGEQGLQDAFPREDTPQAQRVWAATVRRYPSACRPSPSPYET